jgi:hypothetical protein
MRLRGCSMNIYVRFCRIETEQDFIEALEVMMRTQDGNEVRFITRAMNEFLKLKEENPIKGSS